MWNRNAWILLVLLVLPAGRAFGGAPDTHEKIAQQFAPILLQETGAGDKERFDYPTRADFDGDWIATNDWGHAKTYPLPAYVYYSVLETEMHYFIHYAVFHPRDWKGGPVKTKIWDGFRNLSRITDPSRVILDMALSHENDLEGVLVVIEKGPEPRVIFAETLAHSKFTKFATADYLRDHLSLPQNVHLLTIEGGRPVFAVESKGHGIEDPRGRTSKRVLIYRFTGTAEDPEKRMGNNVGYALLSIHDTFWDMAPEDMKSFSTKRLNYSRVSFAFREENGAIETEKVCRNPIGSRIRGKRGAHNFAGFPWGWQTISGKKFLFWSFTHDQPHPGTWFFDPARMIKKHFVLDDTFSTTYLYHPYIVCASPPNITTVAQ